MPAPQAIIQTIEVGGKTLTLETGKLAKQADGAVITRLGDTTTLSTAVTARSAKDGQHFFPLTVDYRERFSAKGAFPGGFFKREGRPTDKETLTSRLIDRTIRPLFPDGFRNEVQVLNYVLAADEEIDADVIAGIGASAALSLSGSPFDGPTAHVRVGRVNGEFVLFPTVAERAESDFDLVVAGKADAIAMVEGEMDEVSEEDMVAALEFGFEAIQTIVAGINEFVAQRDEAHGAPAPLEYETVAPAEELVETIYGKIKDDVDAHLRKDYAKETFYDGIRDIRDALIVDLFGEGDDAADEIDGGYSVGDVKEAFKAAESRVMREMILDEGRRLDGRSTTD
ncbi:MAG: polyribonucleotide nucleotidyltransferase, partial [Bacteroidota bacterium]